MAIKKSQLYSKLWAACDELRGGMDASQYKDYVLVVLFVKYLSDKKKAGDRSLLIELPEGCSFDDFVALKNKSKFEVEDADGAMRTTGIGEMVNIKLAKIADANPDLKDVITNADFADESKLGKGKDLVDTISGLIGVFQDEDLDFSNNRAADDDLIGDAYEYLMKNFATQSGKSKGQFYTPAEVSRIMAKIIGIGKDGRKMITIYDPTCGSGSLLLRAAAEAKGNVAIQGQEKDVATIGMAKMSMVIHGVDDADLRHDNTLSNPLHRKDDRTLETFDYVVANPPFSVKSWMKGANEIDPFGRWGHATNVAPVPPPKCGDYAFLLHILKSMKAQGHGAVILPHGVLFRGNAEADIRKFIVEHRWISGIIGLPPNLFFGTGIPACIIILDKENAAASKGIFMIDAKEGFAKDGAKNRLREEDIRRIVDTWEVGEDVPHYAKFVTWDDIAKNDYNLNIPRYVTPMDKEIRQDLDAHLHGGIPAVDVDEGLARYWAVCPSLKDMVFAPLKGRKGFYEVCTDATLLADNMEGDKSFEKQMLAYGKMIAEWCEGLMREGQKIDVGCDPKKLVEKWGGALLKLAKEKSALVDPYDVYEVFMNYWADVMQDDCYLISRDGWKVPLKMPTKKTWTWRDLECDLLPPQIVVHTFFKDDELKMNALEAKVERIESERDQLQEDSAEIFDDERFETAAKIKKALKEGDCDEDERKILEKYQSLSDDLAKAKKELKAVLSALTTEVVSKYKAISVADIKTCVTAFKWFNTLTSLCGHVMSGVQSKFQESVQSLAARYADTLPDLEAQVKTLRGKVAAHLKEMGVE